MEWCFIAPGTRGHAAPTGLKPVAGVRGGYKHVAPPELGPLHVQEAPADVWPICPHCRRELKFIWVKSW